MKKKPISKGYLLDDSVYLILLKWQNYSKENRSVVARVVVKEQFCILVV